MGVSVLGSLERVSSWTVTTFLWSWKLATGTKGPVIHKSRLAGFRMGQERLTAGPLAGLQPKGLRCLLPSPSPVMKAHPPLALQDP